MVRLPSTSVLALLQLLPLLCPALRISGLGVPVMVHSGDRVRFSCNFNLQGDMLRSVTWYLNNDPFFRYGYGDDTEDVNFDPVFDGSGNDTFVNGAAVNGPSVNSTETRSGTKNSVGTGIDDSSTSKSENYVSAPVPRKKVFNVKGISVDSQGSTLHEVSLSSVDHQASGLIRCTLRATDARHRDSKEANFTVIDAPATGPLIVGRTTGYEMGDMLHLNCTSPPAHPPVLLFWTINEQNPPESYVIEYPGVPDGTGRTSSKTGLRFRLSRDHFSPPSRVLLIHCRSELLQGPGLKSEVFILEADVGSGRAKKRDVEQRGCAGRLSEDAGLLQLLTAALLTVSLTS